MSLIRGIYLQLFTSHMTQLLYESGDTETSQIHVLQLLQSLLQVPRNTCCTAATLSWRMIFHIDVQGFWNVSFRTKTWQF